MQFARLGVLVAGCILAVAAACGGSEPEAPSQLPPRNGSTTTGADPLDDPGEDPGPDAYRDDAGNLDPIEPTDDDGGVTPPAADPVDPPEADPPDPPLPPDPPDPPAPADPADPAGDLDRNFRVLHWNIAGGKENSCAGLAIARAVRRFVREHDVAFVGLNEVCQGRQFEAIRDVLREEWNLPRDKRFSAYYGDGKPRIVGNAIFSRYGLKNVTASRVGTDDFGERNLVCGLAQNLDHLRFCSVHLTPGDGAAAVQLRKTFDIAESYWRGFEDTAILSGDLNLTPNHPALDEVYSADANSPNNPGNNGKYREADDADPKNCLGYGERSQPGTTAGPCRTGQKIDFIFARENRIKDKDYEGNTLNIPGDCTGPCSDHRPVIGRFRVRVRRNER